MKQFYAALIAILLFICGCQEQSQQKVVPQSDTIVAIEVKTIASRPIKSEIAQRLDSLGFINIAEADSTILIDLAYTHADNFTGEILYETLREAYLHPMAMESLIRANQLLKAKHPNYSLLVLDAARPMSIQKRMWNKVKGTPNNIYVANPSKGGGMHNYGMAVDVTIVDEQGEWLPMGTGFDHFGPAAHTTHEEELVAQGIISEEERLNRRLLREVMRGGGFIPLHSEWWHFNRLRREETIQNYQLIE
ncbi:MAG: D-alanyl-D-alanine dipeptidase [Mediterranea massiliensis]|nr:D-alanyl-D-alanine dipeptidase [Mediterranea massiliensis]